MQTLTICTGPFNTTSVRWEWDAATDHTQFAEGYNVYITDEEEKTNEILQELIERYIQGEQGSIAFMVGKIYSGIGDVDLALEWLEKSFLDHEIEMIWLYADPAFENLQFNEQYIDLLKRVGFDV